MRTLAAIAVAFLSTVCSQADEVTKKMLEAAQQCSDAGITKDWDKVAKFMPPVVIEMSGGKDQVIAAAKAADQQLAADQFTVQNATVSEPVRKKEVNGTMYAIIPQQLSIKVPQGMLRHKGYMLGISKQPYGTWHFMSITRGSEPQIKQMFPDIAADFEFPAHEKPVLDAQ